MTPEQYDEIEQFIKQRFDVVEITDENSRGVPTGRYVHCGVFGQAIHYIVQLLAKVKDEEKTI